MLEITADKVTKINVFVKPKIILDTHLVKI